MGNESQLTDILSKLFSDIAKLWSSAAPQYLKGAGDTLLLAVVATAVGCIIGLFCGILQTLSYSKNDFWLKKAVINIVKAVVRIYVEVFRGTPMILQAVFIFFGLPYLTGNALRFDVITAAYIVVSINTGAYMAETVRGGILSIDKGQTEGAMAIGMNHFQTMLKVILPQTLRNIIPQIGNNLIINIKDTSVMFIIGYAELFAAHKSYVGATYLYFPSAVVTMIMYLIMTTVCSLLLRLWEHLMDGPENFNLATTDSLALTSGMNNYPTGRKKRWKR